MGEPMNERDAGQLMDQSARLDEVVGLGYMRFPLRIGHVGVLRHQIDLWGSELAGFASRTVREDYARILLAAEKAEEVEAIHGAGSLLDIADPFVMELMGTVHEGLPMVPRRRSLRLGGTGSFTTCGDLESSAPSPREGAQGRPLPAVMVDGSMFGLGSIEVWHMHEGTHIVAIHPSTYSDRAWSIIDGFIGRGLASRPSVPCPGLKDSTSLLKHCIERSGEFDRTYRIEDIILHDSAAYGL